MILTAGYYLPMFMEQHVLAPIFQAAAKDVETETQTLENSRVAAGQGALPPQVLNRENVSRAGNMTQALTINLMHRLLPAGSEQEGAVVAQALRDEADVRAQKYETLVKTGNNLTDEQVLENAHIRHDQALYKALCLRLAEAMPK